MNQIESYAGALNATECISNGWNLIKQNYWMFFGIAVVGVLILFVLGCIPILNIIAGPILSGPIFVGIYYALLKQMRGEPVDFGMLFQGFNSFVQAMLISLVASSPFIVMQIVQLFNNMGNLAMTIMANKSSGQNSGANPLLMGMSIVVLIVLLILLIVGIVVQISLFFALPLIADHEGLSAMDAVKLSLKAATSNIGGLIFWGF